MDAEDTTRIDEEARAQGISREELLKRAAVAGLAIAGAGGLDRSAADQEARQADRTAVAEDTGRHDPGCAHPLHERHRPGRLQPDGRRQGKPQRWHRCLQVAELLARPAVGPRSESELLAVGPA